MPELPDLEYIVDQLQPRLSGATITSVHVYNPVLLRVLSDRPVDELLAGKTIARLHRHGPFLVFATHDQGHIVIHPMLAGRFHLTPSDAVPKLAASGMHFVFTSGETLLYEDAKQMGKIYILHENQLAEIPRFTTQGPDILTPAFSQAYFLEHISKSRKQVRVFLMDQTVISAIGNAYADEILFAAGLHPKTLCSQVTSEERIRLYQKIVEIMQWGIAEVRKAAAPLPEKVRGHLQVRNRAGQPCLQCGTTIRKAGVLGYDAFFCPKCQPPRRPQFISWQ